MEIFVIIFIIVVFCAFLFFKKHKKYDDLLELPMKTWLEIYTNNYKRNYSSKDMLFSFVVQGFYRAVHLGLINKSVSSELMGRIQKNGTVLIGTVLLEKFIPELYMIANRVEATDFLQEIPAVNASAFLITLLFYPDSETIIESYLVAANMTKY